MSTKSLDFSDLEDQNSEWELIQKFMEGIPDYFTVDGKLRENSLNDLDTVLDSAKDEIKDHQNDSLISREYSSDLILDSNGRTIDCLAVFVN